MTQKKSLFRSSTFRWILALLITLASAVYQRVTGPTYPIRGKTKFEQSTVKYELTRTHAGAGNQPLTIQAADTTISAKLVYRRFPTNENWTSVKMVRHGDSLTGEIPHQPPAGKVEYNIILQKNKTLLKIPEQTVVTRFKGNVPVFFLIPHVLFMFLAMLLSTRTGIEALDRNSNPRKLALWTFLLMFLGGIIFGPLVQKAAFDALWTGVPYGWDLTDNKTLIAFITWLIAIIAGRGQRKARGWIVAASVVTLVIFIIPHSVLGSQLDYETISKTTTKGLSQ